MSVQHDEMIATAAKTVHDKVWALHWKEGATELRGSQVIEYVRELRTAAECTERQLPGELQKLVQEAREGLDGDDGDNKMIELAKLICPLKNIILPVA